MLASFASSGGFGAVAIGRIYRLSLARTTVGQARVAQRLGFVDAPRERREDALDRVPHVGLARKRDVRALEASGALDPHGARPVDHHLVDRRVAQQGLERTEAERA